MADGSRPARMAPLRIHVHDNSGHPFQVQLSRELAARGHSVLHTYMASMQSPKGRLSLQANDPSSLRIEGITLGQAFPKYSYWQRWRAERRYGILMSELLQRERPDVLIAANTPPEMLQAMQKACRRLGIRFVFWVQDLYGYAIHHILGRKYLGFGRLIGTYYKRKESTLLRSSDHAVAITDDFLPFLEKAGLPPDRVSVIPNWAPLEEMPLREKTNAWSREHRLEGRFVFMYSGTLGLKHNPGLLLALAKEFKDDPRVRVVVISEGLGADWLRDAVHEAGLTNLILLPYQPFERMPEVLASADVLVAMLEDSAGVFSVPSKILTYACAGRSILLAGPTENQAAKLITSAGAGTVCPTRDAEKFLHTARALVVNDQLLREMGKNGRRYAERNFDIASIGNRFEALIQVG